MWAIGIITSTKKINFLNPAYNIVITLERMNIQLIRLREQLDKVKNNSERMAIERMIYDINSKILHTYQKISKFYH